MKLLKYLGVIAASTLFVAIMTEVFWQTGIKRMQNEATDNYEIIEYCDGESYIKYDDFGSPVVTYTSQE